MESVNTLSKEVKKLSKKNTKLSSTLDLHKRRPPVCTVCLERMLQGGRPDPAGGEPNSAKGPEGFQTAAAATSIVPPGKPSSKVPFNLEVAMQGPAAAPAGRGSPGGRDGGAVPCGGGGGAHVKQRQVLQSESQPQPRGDVDALLDNQQVFQSAPSMRFPRRDVAL